MKAISLWQPWASAIAFGLKHYETRSWKPPTALVGQVMAIHAAKKQDWGSKVRWCQHRLGIPSGSDVPPNLTEEQKKTIGDAVIEFECLPFGAIVCLCRVVKIWQVVDEVSALRHVGPTEAQWGDYSLGRFYWELQCFYVFDQPIPCVGRQGIFDWQIPDEWIEAAAKEAGMPNMAEIWKAVNK